MLFSCRYFLLFWKSFRFSFWILMRGAFFGFFLCRFDHLRGRLNVSEILNILVDAWWSSVTLNFFLAWENSKELCFFLSNYFTCFCSLLISFEMIGWILSDVGSREVAERLIVAFVVIKDGIKLFLLQFSYGWITVLVLWIHFDFPFLGLLFLFLLWFSIFINLFLRLLFLRPNHIVLRYKQLRWHNLFLDSLHWIHCSDRKCLSLAIVIIFLLKVPLQSVKLLRMILHIQIWQPLIIYFLKFAQANSRSLLQQILSFNWVQIPGCPAAVGLPMLLS